MDPTRYTTASGKDARVRVKPTGKDFGVFAQIKIGGKVVYRTRDYPEGSAQMAKRDAVAALAAF